MIRIHIILISVFLVLGLVAWLIPSSLKIPIDHRWFRLGPYDPVYRLLGPGTLTGRSLKWAISIIDLLAIGVWLFAIVLD